MQPRPEQPSQSENVSNPDSQLEQLTAPMLTSVFPTVARVPECSVSEAECICQELGMPVGNDFIAHLFAVLDGRPLSSHYLGLCCEHRPPFLLTETHRFAVGGNQFQQQRFLGLSEGPDAEQFPFVKVLLHRPEKTGGVCLDLAWDPVVAYSLCMEDDRWEPLQRVLAGLNCARLATPSRTVGMMTRCADGHNLFALNDRVYLQTISESSEIAAAPARAAALAEPLQVASVTIRLPDKTMLHALLALFESEALQRLVAEGFFVKGRRFVAGRDAFDIDTAWPAATVPHPFHLNCFRAFEMTEHRGKAVFQKPEGIITASELRNGSGTFSLQLSQVVAYEHLEDDSRRSFREHVMEISFSTESPLPPDRRWSLLRNICSCMELGGNYADFVEFLNRGDLTNEELLCCHDLGGVYVRMQGNRV